MKLSTWLGGMAWSGSGEMNDCIEFREDGYTINSLNNSGLHVVVIKDKSPICLFLPGAQRGVVVLLRR